MALKYNPSSLPLTASNLKESNVGKIICQGSIEFLKARDKSYFFSVFLHHNENKQSCYMCFWSHWALCFKCDNNDGDTFRGKRSIFSLIVEGLCIWHIGGAVRDNLIASSNISPAVNDYSDLLQPQPHISVTAIIPVSNYRVVLTKLNALIRLTLKKPAGTGLQITLSLCVW